MRIIKSARACESVYMRVHECVYLRTYVCAVRDWEYACMCEFIQNHISYSCYNSYYTTTADVIFSWWRVYIAGML